jgi:hypothetical protein
MHTGGISKKILSSVMWVEANYLFLFKKKILDLHQSVKKSRRKVYAI